MKIELNKVGIQYLEDEALENIFPGYGELLDSIQMCRARKMREHYQYNLMYDNVFSIMGKRGTGKTSVIYTLRENLPELTKVRGDSCMPIITPDVITRNEGIMDWILAVVGEEVSKFKRRIDKMNEHMFDYKAREYDTLNEKIKELHRIYRKLLEYNFSDRYSANNATSFYEVVDNSARRTRNSYQLMQEIGRFWNAYIECLKLYNGNDENPLIFFFFDDIDLAPENVEELLITIRTFLAHSNIIVLITADEETFLEVVENQLDRKMGRYQKDLRSFLRRCNISQLGVEYMEDMTVWDQRGNLSKEAGDPLKDIARMYLGKVMPPSTRYYLTVFDHLEKKKNFICNTDEGAQTLMGLLITQVNELVSSFNGADNFLRYGGRDLDFYLYFIGNTARQIGNEVWIIKGFIDSLIKLNARMKEQTAVNKVYRNVQRFLHSSIIANHKLAGHVKNTEDFVDNLFRVDYDGVRFFVDYEFLNMYMDREAEPEQSEEIDYEAGFQLYALAFFTENIVSIIDRKNTRSRKKQLRGVRYFIDFIGMCGVKKELFRKNIGIGEFLYHYGELLTKFKKIKTNDNTEDDILTTYMYNLSKVERIGTYDKLVSDWYLKEEGWFREISGMLFLYYENVYHFERERVSISLYQPGMKNQYAYKDKISAYIENMLNIYLMNINLSRLAGEAVNFLRDFIEKETQGLLQKCLSSEGEEILPYKVTDGAVSELLSAVRPGRIESGSTDKELLRRWFRGLVYFGIIKEEKDYKNLITNESSWKRIFVKLQQEFAKCDKVLQNVVISNMGRMRSYIDALGEYRNNFYEQTLNETFQIISNKRVAVYTLEEVQPLADLVVEIYTDAERGKNYTSGTIRENYTVYMDTCKRLLNLFDLFVDESDKEYERECRTIANINYAIEIYRITQTLYYCMLVTSEDERAEQTSNNYYYNLYEYMKEDIITDRKEDGEIRDSILSYIVAARKRYIDNIVSRADS